MKKIYLEAPISLTVNGVVVRLRVYNSNGDCSYPTRVTSCNFIYEIKLLTFFHEIICSF